MTDVKPSFAVETKDRNILYDSGLLTRIELFGFIIFLIETAKGFMGLISLQWQFMERNMIYHDNILSAIGNIPLLRLNKMAPKGGGMILAKAALIGQLLIIHTSHRTRPHHKN